MSGRSATISSNAGAVLSLGYKALHKLISLCDKQELEKCHNNYLYYLSDQEYIQEQDNKKAPR
jgi:c-di-GMP-related signal transduction protein